MSRKADHDKGAGELVAPDFQRAHLIPAVAQDASSKEVLMVAYMDQEAWERTMETGFAHYHSRSRNALWKKGESSGHVQKVREIRIDCDRDTVLLLVDQTGPACHTGNRSCFYRSGGGLPVAGNENPRSGD
ncbi:MAG: phosphoribosyl-AMP cyclohydrolase [Spirochaetales bacterium]|nr:MAG: phosphoribosyl-AMP cyclohydrolase [Spirochaetales bacterium]